jgi:hypothetical protein
MCWICSSLVIFVKTIIFVGFIIAVVVQVVCLLFAIAVCN